MFGNPAKYLVFDLDGVCCDFDRAIIRRFGKCDVRFYSLEKRWPRVPSQIIRREVANPLLYLTLDEIPLAWKAVNFVRSLGYSPIAVTSRPYSIGMELATRAWLYWNDVHFDQLRFIDFEHKPEYVKSLNPIAVIDDAPKHLTRMRALGLRAIAFNQMWNIFEDCCDYRIASWEQFIRDGGNAYRVDGL